MNKIFGMANSPSFDARNVSDERIDPKDADTHENTTSSSVQLAKHHQDGMAVLVEPSFDAEDPAKKELQQENKLAAAAAAAAAERQQSRSPRVDDGRNEPEARASPSKEQTTKPGHKHRRDLSEHFYDAARISAKLYVDGEQAGLPPPFPGAADDSLNVGNKHRRVFSGDMGNPPMAHRRINSIGESAAVKRRSYGPLRPKKHHRVDSAGLDVLTAAVDASSREDIEKAMGANKQMVEAPKWIADPSDGFRRAPLETAHYDYANGLAPRHDVPYHHRYPRYPQQHPSFAPPPPQGYYNPQGPHPYYPQQHQPQHHHPRQHPLQHPHPSQHPSQHQVPHGYPNAMGYPMQYSREHEHLKASHAIPRSMPGAPVHATTQTQPEPVSGNVAADLPQSNKYGPTTPPVQPTWPGRNGTTQGVQTHLTSIGVAENRRYLHPTPEDKIAEPHTSMFNPADQVAPPAAAAAAAVSGGHHRKLSSFSSLGPLSSIFQAPEQGEHPLKTSHHRATSSTVSFLQGFDVGVDPDAAFIRNLQASTGLPESKDVNPAATLEPKEQISPPSPVSDGPQLETSSKLAPGGTSKRVRRKCTKKGCENRVVQGGLCISHGAKRKTCKHPDCTKHVKKAGLCSTHGPARKKCGAPGCSKVAVQGGRCIAHGAKKKTCEVEGCVKQSILNGMCKRHHDENERYVSKFPPAPALPSVAEHPQCHDTSVERGNSFRDLPTRSTRSKKSKPGHTRGLSIFQDLSADTVRTLLQPEELAAKGGAAEAGGGSFYPPQGGPQSRDYGSAYHR